MNGASRRDNPGLLTATVRVTEGDGDPERVANAAESLRLDILTLDAVTVSSTPADPEDVPDGARVVDPAEVGELVVLSGSSAEVVRQLITIVASWRRSRQVSRTGSVEVEIGDARISFTNPTAEQQERLVDAFIKRVGDADQ